MDFENVAKRIQDSIDRDEQALALLISHVEECEEQMREAKIHLDAMALYKAEIAARLKENKQRLSNLETYVLEPGQVEAIENEKDDLLRWYRENNPNARISRL